MRRPLLLLKSRFTLGTTPTRQRVIIQNNRRRLRTLLRTGEELPVGRGQGTGDLFYSEKESCWERSCKLMTILDAQINSMRLDMQLTLSFPTLPSNLKLWRYASVTR